MTTTAAELADHFVEVGGLRTRYVEQGQGPAVLFLHGGSLGSSADVFLRNLPAFARAGFRAIAYDQPGFGLTDTPNDHSLRFRREHVLAFMDALGLKQAALVAHSQAGAMGAQLALAEPNRITHLAVLGTGSLLPPQEAARDGVEGAAQQRLERRMAEHEPSIDDTRKLLEANLFHRELITPEELQLRHARSVGACFEAFVARSMANDPAPKKPDAVPLWRRLTEIKQPLLLIYGRNDRGHALERATKLKELFPQLDLHLVADCKHLVPWDAQQQVDELTTQFLKRPPTSRAR
jgi:4,5:9,10-diseco-3-hydroxy-5,9,17-trioxoandrosta-1(10),2-diene-4-oate hydrolase